ncbi:UvrD-helicase domain-containing protein [Methylobacter psychrophilus]|uniref:UvrD-helicase domain-containing protein n=1 Tax=Methylobacter psychrophilus TaxID=96941 RepID=UPI0021D50DD6|nr:UvrD-helicase domain-containing protein [Methylobacter psychrophilus]
MPHHSTTFQPLSYRLNYWARRFASHSPYPAFSIGNDNLVFGASSNRQHSLPLLSIILPVTVKSGWFWDTLVITQEDGNIFRFGGVAKNKSQQLRVTLNHHASNTFKSFYQQLEPALKHAAQEAEVLFFGKHYIRQALAEQWLSQHQSLSDSLKRKDCFDYLTEEALQNYQRISPLLEPGLQHINVLNQAFVKQQVGKYRAFFDQVESNPLTEQQRKACVIDEQNNLILAGAGTGKTSTMIGRAGYLVKAGLAQPQQILLLAYANKAAEEMDQRIKDKLGIDKLTVKTFHSLGKHIITQVEGEVPLIDKMAEDDLLRVRFIDGQIQQLLGDNLYKSRLVNYFLRFTYPYKNPFSFNNLAAYNAYLLENELRTLQGELVKSYEECEIANFLYRQGVAYQYEANYAINTAGPDYKVYQPDFYLPDYGIYIEHFAVNEHNQTPVFIDQKSYLEGMEWKRALHQKHHTPLIETYSYLKQQGRLTTTLSEKLLAAGVQFNPLPQNTLLAKLKELGRVSEFSQLMAQILALFKAANINIKQLVELASQHEDHERLRAAAYLFEPVYEAYQQQLRDTASIDFEDMIGLAIDYVESGCYQSPYRYLLVDEFQDISASRARLLKALMAQQPESSLFCVGDDWQSIYRFTGSDVSLTKNFDIHFGATATSVLDKTFRFNNKIGDLASRFVTQNPEQIKKQLRSHHRIKHNAVSLIKTNQDIIGIQAALTAINTEANQPASVLLLARFNFKKPDVVALKRQYPQLTINFMTVHAAKGKEADYVVILGLDKGKHGFPSEKPVHPLLEWLLPKAETYEHAEERRLFYVALTRARHHVYLITDGNNASPFVRELINNRYPVNIDEFTGNGFQDKIADILCSHCQAGYKVPKNSQYGSFFGCSNYPLCAHTERACQWCGGGLQIKGKFNVCENKRCDYREPLCPKCNSALSLRKGRYGQFWGCTNYRKEIASSCTYTEPFIDSQDTKQQ